MSYTTPRPPPAFADPLQNWNHRYRHASYLFGEAPNHYLAQQAGLLAPGTALSIADGEGRNSVWLARQGLSVDAFDFSPVGVAKAQALAQRAGVQVRHQCSAWEDFAWPTACYDNVVGVFFQFASPTERQQLFQKMDQALKPGGILLIQGYGKDQLQYNTGGPGKLEHLYDEALMRESFAGYQVLDSRTYTAHVQEGEGHDGPSALIGFVARKG